MRSIDLPAGLHVVDLVPRGDDVVISRADGLVAIANLDGDVRIVRPADPEPRLISSRIVAAGDEIVLWGWEVVVALAPDGRERWSYDEGEHSLDEDEGPFAAVTGVPCAILPNGCCIDTRTGDWLDAPRWVDELVLAAPHPRRGAVIATRAAVIYWDGAAPPVTVAALPAPPVALACDGDDVLVALGDGPVLRIDPSGAIATAFALPVSRYPVTLAGHGGSIAATVAGAIIDGREVGVGWLTPRQVAGQWVFATSSGIRTVERDLDLGVRVTAITSIGDRVVVGTAGGGVLVIPLAP
jgi:hypothetical protein